MPDPIPEVLLTNTFNEWRVRTNDLIGRVNDLGTTVQGTQGTQGTQGRQGAQGTQGLQGLQGTQGVQGAQGSQGTQGLQGLQGTQGTQGLQGTQGAGIQGPRGTQGADGATGGTQGSAGSPGAQGSAGSPGAPGAQGASGSISGSPQLDSLGVGVVASGVTGEIRATGNITAYHSSDERLKENIREIANALELVQSIRGVRYDWTDDYIRTRGGPDEVFLRKNDIGVIAQDLQSVLPEIVVRRTDGYLAVKYERIAPLLIQAIRELLARVEHLEEKLKE